MHSNGAAPTFDRLAPISRPRGKRSFRSGRKPISRLGRDARDRTAQKYAMWARGEELPSQKPRSLMTRRCGVRFGSHRLEHNLVHVPRATE
jgi:hypothetical protein